MMGDVIIEDNELMLFHEIMTWLKRNNQEGEKNSLANRQRSLILYVQYGAQFPRILQDECRDLPSFLKKLGIVIIILTELE